MATVRLGVFGGTFDPPHLGHLVAATHTRRLAVLDRVLWVVANDPWQKSAGRAGDLSPAVVRLEMVRAAVEGHEGQLASDAEIVRGGPSYTVDTVEELVRAHPDAELVLVLGRDAAAGLDTWHRAAELREQVEVAVVGRPEGPGAGAALPGGWRFTFPDVPAIGVSSTDLRARYRDGRPTDVIVAPGVDTVIRGHDLYRGRR